MIGIWIVIPPWFFAVLVSLIGRWGEGKWLRTSTAEESSSSHRFWPDNWGAMLITNLVFLSLVPTSLLAVIGVLLPFNGARAGLSLGLLAFLLGCVPSRLLDAHDAGWDRTLWVLLIDLLRVGGAMAIVGYLVA